MRTKTIQLTASFTAGGNALATHTVVKDCFVVAVQTNLTTAPTAAGAVIMEVSKYPSLQSGVNDAQGVIDRSEQYINIANGPISAGVHHAISGIAIPLLAGERIYLHAAGGAQSSVATTLIHVTD